MTISMGTLVFAAGAVLILVGVIIMIVQIASGPSQKKKIQERMKEKY